MGWLRRCQPFARTGVQCRHGPSRENNMWLHRGVFRLFRSLFEVRVVQEGGFASGVRACVCPQPNMTEKDETTMTTTGSNHPLRQPFWHHVVVGGAAKNSCTDNPVTVCWILNGVKRTAAIAYRWKCTIVMAVLALASMPHIRGLGMLRGGKFGRLMDNTVRLYIFESSLSDRTMELRRDHGLVLPPLEEPDFNTHGIPNLPQSGLFELLRRASEQDQAVQKITAAMHNDDGPISNTIPPHIVQPNVGTWFRSLHLESQHESQRPTSGRTTDKTSNGNGNDGTLDQLRLLSFREDLLEKLIPPSLESVWWQYMDVNSDDRALLGSVLALYKYGGYWFDNTTDTIFNPTVYDSDNKHQNTIGIEQFGTCVFNTQQGAIVGCAVRPHHPVFGCLVRYVENSPTGAAGLYHGMLETLSNIATSTGVSLPKQELVGCQDGRLAVLGRTETPSNRQDLLRIRFVAGNMEKRWPNKDDGKSDSIVHITEAPSSGSNHKTGKVHISELLRDAGCKPGWLCHRCYRSPFYGTYDACKTLCRRCYQDIVCADGNLDDVHLQLTVPRELSTAMLATNGFPASSGSSSSSGSLLSLSPTKRRIPRIIHQTWFEDITPDRYPDLARLQNSWRASGWEYRFYNDKAAREYVQRNFPKRVLDAYDDLIPGAFKVSFVLMLGTSGCGGQLGQWCCF